MSQQPLKGTINIKVDQDLYRPLYPLTDVNQVKGFNQRVIDLVGKNVHSEHDETFIDSFYSKEIKSINGKPVKIIASNSITANIAETDHNQVPLTLYIKEVKQPADKKDEIFIQTGNEFSENHLIDDGILDEKGKTIIIDNVEHAQKDSNNIILHSYVNRIKQFDSDSIQVLTGEDVFTNKSGNKIVIDNVQHARSAHSDEEGNSFISTYAKKEHKHDIKDVNGLQEYVDDELIKLVNNLLLSGRIKLASNTIELCQYDKYDFDDNETVTIALTKNAVYNRPQIEVLKLSTNEIDNRDESIFSYKFDINKFVKDDKYIDDKLSIITTKSLQFGSPRKLGSGFMSRSGIITLDEIQQLIKLEVN